MASEVSAELEQFVEREVANGHFPNRDSVIEHALRLLQRDREEAVKGIKAGLEDFAAGRTQPIDVAFGELRAELGVAEDA